MQGNDRQNSEGRNGMGGNIGRAAQLMCAQSKARGGQAKEGDIPTRIFGDMAE